jgi:hypothetical protein
MGFSKSKFAVKMSLLITGPQNSVSGRYQDCQAKAKDD